MVGQKNNLDYLSALSIQKVPHFIVFVGSKGSGKTTLSHYIADKLNATFSVCGIKVDEIREVIDTAYHTKDKIVYCIQNADTMRNEAKNAMLKITEEPPENAYFVLTVQDDSTLLDTIKSRATVIQMEPYSRKDLMEYCIQESIFSDFVDIATNPYELHVLNTYGNDFIDYVNLVVDNISEVDSANAFKSGNKLALKTESDEYDLKLFWQCFIHVCEERLLENPLHYSKGIITTNPYLSKISKLGVNKQQIYDRWVFEIREVWL